MSEVKKRKIEYSTDPNKWLEWYNAISDESDDDLSGDEGSSSEIENHTSESEHNTDSEQEASEDENIQNEMEEEIQGHMEEEIIESSQAGEEVGPSVQGPAKKILQLEAQPQKTRRDLFYFGKSENVKWKKHRPSTNVRTRACNLITHLPGPRGKALKTKNALEIFDLFFDDSVIRIIVTCTNIYIDKIQENFERERDAKLTDSTEIRAFIGLLLLIGCFRSSRKNLSNLWNNSRGNGMESCYLTMSEKRFRFLLRCLRFDDIRDRKERRELDKLAPIREITEVFVNNCQKFYTPGEYLTVDEQLLAFRGRCAFKQYIPSKPAKYGMKVFALVDAKTAYTISLEPYVGKQPPDPYSVSNSAEDIVLRLVQPVENSNRNITGDNWFTSLSLVNRLVDKKLTYCGTLRKIRKEVPKELLPHKNRQVYSSVFGFQQNCTIVSYCTKKNKAVLLLSSMHFDDAIDHTSGDKYKPEIVTFYNMTKVGVDLVDQLCQNYNTARNSRRWPMVLFYDFVNIAAINSLCIYKFHCSQTGKMVKRADFLKELSWELIKPQIEARSTVENIPRELRRRAKLLLYGPVPEPVKPRGVGGRGRCYDCGRVRDRKTQRYCIKCKKWACADHLNDICNDCLVE